MHRIGERDAGWPRVGHAVGRLSLLALLLSGVAACAASRNLHIRGQLDRDYWMIRTCDTGETYELIGSSGDAANFIRLENEMGLEDGEPVIVEFDVSTVPGNLPWKYEWVAKRSAPKLERGFCPPIPK